MKNDPLLIEFPWECYSYLQRPVYAPRETFRKIKSTLSTIPAMVLIPFLWIVDTFKHALCKLGDVDTNVFVISGFAFGLAGCVSFMSYQMYKYPQTTTTLASFDNGYEVQHVYQVERGTDNVLKDYVRCGKVHRDMIMMYDVSTETMQPKPIYVWKSEREMPANRKDELIKWCRKGNWK